MEREGRTIETMKRVRKIGAAQKWRLDVSTTERNLKISGNWHRHAPAGRAPSRRDVIQIEKERSVAKMQHLQCQRDHS